MTHRAHHIDRPRVGPIMRIKHICMHCMVFWGVRAHHIDRSRVGPALAAPATPARLAAALLPLRGARSHRPNTANISALDCWGWLGQPWPVFITGNCLCYDLGCFRLTPLQCWLVTPELQRQLRGKRHISQGQCPTHVRRLALQSSHLPIQLVSARHQTGRTAGYPK